MILRIASKGIAISAPGTPQSHPQKISHKKTTTAFSRNRRPRIQGDTSYPPKSSREKKAEETSTIFPMLSSVTRPPIETTRAPTPAPKKEKKGSTPAITPHKSGLGKPSRYMLPPTAAPKTALI